MLRVLPYGGSALLVELAGPREVLDLHAALSVRPPPWLEDLVPAERTVLIRFDPAAVGADQVTGWVRAARPVPVVTADTAELVIAVRYDGADLEQVGRLTGLGPDGVVSAHIGTGWTVAFTGFAPGFGYLTGDSDRLRVPRLDSPRPRVPAGAVALAGHYCGIYPRASPGGWQLIGSTAAVLWDVDRDPPALLRPGTRVRFTRVAP